MQELLEYQLKDLHNAESLILEAFPTIISNISNEELKKALEMHQEETKSQKYRLEKAADALGIDPAGERCTPVEACLREIRKMIRNEKDKLALDAGLSSVLLKIEQYEIAEYTTAHQYARRLGLHSLAELLAETLGQEKDAEKNLKQFGESVAQEAEPLEF